MRFKFTIILLLLNAAAFGFLYYQEYRKDLARDYLTASPTVLPDAIDIGRMVIEISTDNVQEVRELERVRDEWRIVRPFDWPANDNAVQRILNQLRFLQRDVTIPLKDVEQSGQTLADFGLEEPQFRLTYWSGAGESTLKIGAPTRMGSRLYMLPPDSDEILVVDQDLLKSMTLPLEQLRSQRVFDIPVFEARSLVIQTGDSRLRLEKRTGENWYFETPIQTRGSDERVKHMLNMLIGIKALKLLGPDPSRNEELGLTNNPARVTVGGGDRRQTLVLGNRVAETPQEGDAEPGPARRYARLESHAGASTAFEVDATNFDWLDKALEELRERRFMRFEPARVETIEVSQGQDLVTLQRLEKSSEQAANQWQVLDRRGNGRPATQPGDPDLIQSMLEDLRGLEASGFVSDAPSNANLEEWGLSPPQMSVKLDGDRTLSLNLGEIGKKAPHNVFAKLGDAPFVYEVRPRIYTQVHADPLHYRLRVLETLPQAARVRTFRLSDLETEEPLYDLALDSEKQTWEDLLQGLEDGVSASLITLIKAARNFPVRNYLYPKFEAYSGLPWQYRMEVEIHLPGGETDQVERRSLYFSRRDGASRQVGGSPDTEMTFTLTQPLVDALYAVTVEQAPPEIPADPDNIEQADPEGMDVPKRENNDVE